VQNGLWLLCKSPVVFSAATDLSACSVERATGSIACWGRTSVLVVPTDLLEIDSDTAPTSERSELLKRKAHRRGGLPFLLPSANGPSLEFCMAIFVEARSFQGTFSPPSPCCQVWLAFLVCMMNNLCFNFVFNFAGKRRHRRLLLEMFFREPEEAVSPSGAVEANKTTTAHAGR
jgi:hypothetical protein